MSVVACDQSSRLEASDAQKSHTGMQADDLAISVMLSMCRMTSLKTSCGGELM